VAIINRNCLCMTAGFPLCRHILSLIGFFVFINLFTLRVNLSVAILAMVNTTYLRELEATVANVSSNSSSVLSDEHELRAIDDNSSSLADDYDNVRICISKPVS